MQRAFVVQLRTDSRPGESLRGRVEDVCSGHMTHFENIGQLVEFFFRSLENQPTEEGPRRENCESN